MSEKNIQTIVRQFESDHFILLERIHEFRHWHVGSKNQLKEHLLSFESSFLHLSKEENITPP